MRIWHKDLISVLPKQQLLGQWRELCAIARNIAVNGTPNHLLVNKVLQYPAGHLYEYGTLIHDEMVKRGYKCDFSKFAQWFRPWISRPSYSDLFDSWHDERYLRQCFYNLQEKYDCGGIPEDEWEKVYERMDDQ